MSGSPVSAETPPGKHSTGLRRGEEPASVLLSALQTPATDPRGTTSLTPTTSPKASVIGGRWTGLTPTSTRHPLPQGASPMHQLTPIDRGEVYEPKPWDLIDPDTNAVDHDRCGRVDFDNDESATLFVTRLVERSPQARDLDDLRPTLEVESLADVRLTINLDGDDVFTHVPAHLKDVTMPLHDRLDDADVLRFGREVIAAL